MSKIIFVLFATILVANVVLAAPEPEDYEEELSQEVQELLDYQKASLASQIFLNNFAYDVELADDNKGRCRRPVERCNLKNKCCSKLRCSRLLRRCIPKKWVLPPTM